MRDPKTEEYKRHIGHVSTNFLRWPSNDSLYFRFQGVKIKMDDAGNILIKRVSKCNVYIKSTGQDEETAIGNEILKLPGCALEPDKPFKVMRPTDITRLKADPCVDLQLFDMKKFQSNVNRELRRAYPDRRRLECQCLSAIAFVKAEQELLECPIWVLIINVVAMDMLKSKLPPGELSVLLDDCWYWNRNYFNIRRVFPVSIAIQNLIFNQDYLLVFSSYFPFHLTSTSITFYISVQRVMDIKNRPRIPVPDEDPYSVAGNGSGSSGSSGFAGTGSVAATREQLLLQTQQHAQRRGDKPPKLPPRENMYPHDIPKPDYDDHEDEQPRMKPFQSSRGKEKSKDNKKYGNRKPHCSPS